MTGHARAPPPKTKDYYNNHARVMAHSDHTPPSDYQSTAHAAMSQKVGVHFIEPRSSHGILLGLSPHGRFFSPTVAEPRAAAKN